MHLLFVLLLLLQPAPPQHTVYMPLVVNGPPVCGERAPVDGLQVWMSDHQPAEGATILLCARRWQNGAAVYNIPFRATHKGQALPTRIPGRDGIVRWEIVTAGAGVLSVQADGYSSTTGYN